MDYGATTCPKDEEVIVIPEKFRHVFYGYEESEFAGMANPSNKHDEESGLLTVDCGASTTISESLTNMTEVVPKVVTIQLAMDGMTMQKLILDSRHIMFMIKLVQSDQLRQEHCM